MCENNCNCPIATEAINLSEGATVIPVPTMEDAKQAYFNSLQYDIKKLQADLEEEKENGERFQELYTCCLGHIMKTLDEKDINVLDEAVKKLAEIETKYMKR